MTPNEHRQLSEELKALSEAWKALGGIGPDKETKNWLKPLFLAIEPHLKKDVATRACVLTIIDVWSRLQIAERKAIECSIGFMQALSGNGNLADFHVPGDNDAKV